MKIQRLVPHRHLPPDLALPSVHAADDPTLCILWLFFKVDPPVADDPVLTALGLAALIGRRNIRIPVPLFVDSVGKPFVS